MKCSCTFEPASSWSMIIVYFCRWWRRWKRKQFRCVHVQRWIKMFLFFCSIHDIFLMYNLKPGLIEAYSIFRKGYPFYRNVPLIASYLPSVFPCRSQRMWMPTPTNGRGSLLCWATTPQSTVSSLSSDTTLHGTKNLASRPPSILQKRLHFWHVKLARRKSGF